MHIAMHVASGIYIPGERFDADPGDRSMTSTPLEESYLLYGGDYNYTYMQF